MQWDGAPQAGFTTGLPWLPVSQTVPTVNVQQASGDPSSLFQLYRRLIRLRKSMPALLHGAYVPCECDHQDVVVFLRRDEREDGSGHQVLTAVNFSGHQTVCSVPAVRSEGTILLSPYARQNQQISWHRGRLDLQPDEAVVVELKPEPVHLLPNG